MTHVGPQLGSTSSSKALGGFSCYPDCGDGDKSVPIYNVGYNLVDVPIILQSTMLTQHTSMRKQQRIIILWKTKLINIITLSSTHMNIQHL